MNPGTDLYKVHTDIQSYFTNIYFKNKSPMLIILPENVKNNFKDVCKKLLII